MEFLVFSWYAVHVAYAKHGVCKQKKINEKISMWYTVVIQKKIYKN